MRSESATPPGSRSSSTGRSRASSACSAAASVDFPAPSMPSSVMSRPRTYATLPFSRASDLRPRAPLTCCPGPSATRTPAPCSAPRWRRAARRATPTCSAVRRAAASARWRARSPRALLTEGAADPAGAAARVAHGAHPDLTWVAPASAAGILVGDVDQAVVAGAARTPFESSRRVFVIEDADELNDQAANRMLKTLEEPPSFAHLILLTSRPGEVLPTIASRCQPVRFDAPSVEEIAARLERHGIAPAPPTPAPGSASATPRARWRSPLGDGPALRAGAEAVARGALRDEIAGRPWTALLDHARAAGARAGDGDRARARRRARLRDRQGPRAPAPRGGRARQARGAPRADGGARPRPGARRAVAARRRLRRRRRARARPPHRPAARAREDAALGQGAARLRAAQGLVEETRASLQFNPNEELALDALGSRLARTLRGDRLGSRPR